MLPRNTTSLNLSETNIVVAAEQWGAVPPSVLVVVADCELSIAQVQPHNSRDYRHFTVR